MTTGISIRNIRRTFGARRALDDVSLDVRPGEMVALLGASGSGKSTLLRHIAGLVAADRGSGAIEVGGRVVQTDGRIARDVRRVRTRIGFVFQQFNLVDRLPVLTNVLAGLLHEVPLHRSLLRRFRDDERRRGLEALERVGIRECAWQRASTLSGGQQQRAAISRALVQGAGLILADEPIASLDPESSRRVMSLLAEINRDLGVTVVVSLHQVDYALAYCARTVALRDGRVVFDGPSARLDRAQLRELYGVQVDTPEPVGATASRPSAEAIVLAA